MATTRKNSWSEIPPEAEVVFTGKIFKVYQWQQQLYDGTAATFEKLTRADSAGVIPVTEDGGIILAHQEQPSLAPFWGLLGGIVDPGETPLEAAKRELKEEAGLAAENWYEWFSVSPHSKIIWNIHAFIAKNVQKISEQHLEAGEKIKVVTVSFDEFMKLAQQDDFRDREVTMKVLSALAHPEEMVELKRLLQG